MTCDSNTLLFGGLEAGGTKFVCLIGTSPTDIRAETRFPTTTPGETIGRAIDFFRQHQPLAAIGIGSFGPVDLDPGPPAGLAECCEIALILEGMLSELGYRVLWFSSKQPCSTPRFITTLPMA